MKQNILYLISIALLATVFTGCSDSDESFDNKIYIASSAMTTNILMQSEDTDEASFQVSMPKTENRDVTFTISAESSLVSTYNEAYYDNAIMLPEANYSISETQVTINAGTVSSSPITVYFKGLTELDRNQRYVLPVSINTSSIGVLQSARTMYYLIKGAALINVVADMEENNVYVDWKDNSQFTAMRKFTAEALIRPRNFDRMLTTVMGIEGKFLIRIGDSGIPSNQLQVATPNINYTSSDLAIPTNEWTHIAVTYDAGDASTAPEIQVFINGKNILKAAADPTIGAVNWGVPHSDESNGQPRCFWIGYAYDNNRYLAGEISECRVWNKVLTTSDLNEENHFYFVDPSSEGLIAYWKFNDGGGNTVKDYSIYGNDATSSYDLKWNAVELPAE
jgi:hypothetical protein